MCDERAHAPAPTESGSTTMLNVLKATFGGSATVLQAMALQRDRVLILVLKFIIYIWTFFRSTHHHSNRVYQQKKTL